MDRVVAMRLLAFGLLGLLLPQAVGFAAFRWTRTKALPLKIATILIPPLLFFLTAYLYWTDQARSMHAAGQYVCGMMGMLATFTTMFGALLHGVVGAFAFAVLSLRSKRHAVAKPV